MCVYMTVSVFVSIIWIRWFCLLVLPEIVGSMLSYSKFVDTFTVCQHSRFRVGTGLVLPCFIVSVPQLFTKVRFAQDLQLNQERAESITTSFCLEVVQAQIPSSHIIPRAQACCDLWGLGAGAKPTVL